MYIKKNITEKTTTPLFQPLKLTSSSSQIIEYTQMAKKNIFQIIYCNCNKKSYYSRDFIE